MNILATCDITTSGHTIQLVKTHSSNRSMRKNNFNLSNSNNILNFVAFFPFITPYIIFVSHITIFSLKKVFQVLLYNKHAWFFIFVHRSLTSLYSIKSISYSTIITEHQLRLSCDGKMKYSLTFERKKNYSNEITQLNFKLKSSC